MGADDKTQHKAEEMVGKVKQGVGKATDNERLEAEGHAEETKADLKQAGDLRSRTPSPTSDGHRPNDRGAGAMRSPLGRSCGKVQPSRLWAYADSRITRLVGRIVEGCTVSPSMSRTSTRAISAPISSDGWCTVVSGGTAVAA